MTTLKTASVLSFERKLDVSDALMYAGNWEDKASKQWQPIHNKEKSVRGTISNRFKAGNIDQAKLDADMKNPNPQTVDAASLSENTDTLKVQFTLRVLAGVGEPSACNDADYREKLTQTVQGYIAKNGLNELATRYALNLANGRFLWRNRIGAESVQVYIDRLVQGEAAQTWVFDALEFSLLQTQAPIAQNQAAKELAAIIESGLTGSEHVLFRVRAYVRMGEGQEVFPSQELILEKTSKDKSKTLYDVNGIAAMHSQKIGNALRTIDSWYKGADENGPIAVEPYGSVTTQGKAWRGKEKQDFYSLLDGWVLKDKEPELDQQHFVIATLIRGGVFGEAK